MMVYLSDTNVWFDILQIASIAALNGLILVTSNTREFTRISGLQFEDSSV